MRARVLLWLAWLLPVSGCADLPAVASGVCGNAVVDPDEDCDTYATEPNTLCRPPGTPGQCRYACGPQPDGPVCPTGMGCGIDGTCRAASGTFKAPSQPSPGKFLDLFVGDLDGDGRDDVVGLEAGDIATSYFDSTLAASTSRAPRGEGSDVYPLLGDLTGDGLADLLVGVHDGALVYLGSRGRALVPTSSPSVRVASISDAQVIVLRSVEGNKGDTFFLMFAYLGGSLIGLSQPGGQLAVFEMLPQPPSALAGPAVVGHLVEDPTVSPCGDIALAFKGAGEVDVFTACAPDGNGGFKYKLGAKPATVALPAGSAIQRGPLLLDVNHDGHLDLVIGASRCSSCNEVDVAYGVGDGTFHSDPAAIPKSSGNELFAVYPPLAGVPLPLALGDVNGDGVADQVTEKAVLVSRVAGGSATFTVAAQNDGAPWTEAVIADFNRDGTPDVAAGSDSAPNVAFFNGVGDGTLNPFVVPSAPVEHLVVGDFDGDLVNDLGVIEVASAADPLGDSVSILFGNAVGAPSQPLSMGHFVSIRQLAAGQFADVVTGVVPGASGLVSVSLPTGANTFIGLFASAGDRVLRSPLSMVETMPNLVGWKPWRYAIGQFTGSGPVQVAGIKQQVTGALAYESFLIPTDGQGLDSVNARRGSGLAPGGLQWAHAAVAAIDLDGDGADELVALGPSDGGGKGAVAIARAVPGPKSDPPPLLAFAAAPHPTIDAVVDHEETDAIAAQAGRMLSRDLDGDGRPDLIAIDSTAPPHVVVFWNDGSGDLGPMTAVPAPQGQPTVDVAAIDAGGGGPSLAVLTAEAVTLVTFAGRVPAVASSPSFPVAGGQRIATGDIDGDGVPDLVVSDRAGFAVYRGAPTHP